HVVSVNSSTAAFTVNWSGTDAGGSGLMFVDLFAQVDDGAPQAIGHIAAGAPNVAEIHTGSITYGAVVDGRPHNYRFYSVGVDGGGNVELPPRGATDDVVVTDITFTPPRALELDAINVQKGM